MEFLEPRFLVYVPFFTVNSKNQPSVIEETFLSVKDADSDAKLFVERNGIYSSWKFITCMKCLLPTFLLWICKIKKQKLVKCIPSILFQCANREIGVQFCILKVSQFVRQTTKFDDRKVVFVQIRISAAIFLLLLPIVRFYVKTNAREEAGVSDRYGML